MFFTKLLTVQVLEKHITLEKTMKGTDHVCSLTPPEFQQLVRDVRVIENALGTPIKKVVTSGVYTDKVDIVDNNIHSGMVLKGPKYVFF